MNTRAKNILIKDFHSGRSLLRAVGIMTAFMIGATGITFAALQSDPGVLRGSSIQTAVASLQVSPNGTTYGSSMDGYAFSNLIPGGQPSPANGYPVYIKNVGTTPLALKLSVSPSITNPQNVNLAKVHLVLSSTSGGAPQNITLQDLVAANSTGGVAITQGSHMLPAQVSSFLMQITMDSDAITGSTASLSTIDFNFGAAAVN